MIDHEPSDEPLGAKQNEEFMNELRSLGAFLEAEVRGEPVPATPEDIRDILVKGLSTVHRHTVQLASEIDRLESEVQGEPISATRDEVNLLAKGLFSLNQQRFQLAIEIERLKATVRDLGGTD